MTGGGGGDAPLAPACNGGEFLLSLLQKSQQHSQQQLSSRADITPPQQPSLPNDPAVAAVGPTINFSPQWPSNGRDVPPPWPHTLSPPFPHNFLGFAQNPWPSPANQQQMLCEDFGRLGLSNMNYAIRNLIQPEPNHREQPQNLVFGSYQSQSPSPIQTESSLNLNRLDDLKYNYPNGLDRNFQFDPRTSSVMNPNSFQHRNLENSREQDGRLGKQHYGSTPPPGFSNKARGGGGNSSRRAFEHSVDKSNRVISSSVEDGRPRRLSFEDGKIRGGNAVGLTGQLDHPGPPSGSNLHSNSALDIEESLLDLHIEDRERLWGQERTKRETGARYVQGGGGDDMDDFGEELVDSLLPEDETDYKNDKKQHRNSRDKVNGLHFYCVFLLDYFFFQLK